MKNYCLLLLACLSLSGCVASAIVSSSVVGGALLYDKRKISTILADRHITQTAENLIAASPELQGRSNINIATFNHITLLVGQAQTPDLKQRAYQLVAAVPGINRIYNQINIAGATSSLQNTNDSWLTAKIKSSLLAKRGLNSTQLKIVTENNITYIMGEVTQQQGELIANVVRRVPGVTKVVKVFQYVQ